MALTYSQIVSTTLKNYTKLFDNIFKKYPLTEKLLAAGKVDDQDGGEKIFIPIEYAANDTVGWIAKNGTISTDPQEIITGAEDQWRILAGTVLFNDLEGMQNRGSKAIVKLMKAKIKNLEKAMTKNLAESLHTAQTGQAMNGLPDIVSTSGDLHGIAVSDAAAWASAYANDTSEPLAIIDMATAYNTVSDGNDTVDLIDSSQTLYEKYESLVQPQLRFTDSRTADAGFKQNLTYKSAVVVLDKDCDSDRMYFLNTDYLYIVAMSGRKFHAFPAVQASNQINDVVKVVFYGNLMCSNRWMQGMLDGRTA